jgi:hypothetical protein
MIRLPANAHGGDQPCRGKMKLMPGAANWLVSTAALLIRGIGPV